MGHEEAGWCPLFLGVFQMKVEVKTLAELSSQEFCRIVEERVCVFVVEQQCPYQEVDDQDYGAHHLLLKNDRGQLVDYTRIMDKDADRATFGRVLVPKQFRGHQYGRQLVQTTIDHTKRLYPGKKIQIQAQGYLQKFYESFGFKPVSAVYLEDGIPHLDMVK